MAMTSEKYAEIRGMCCPSCGSSDIQGESIEVSAGFAAQDCMCNECLAEWRDEYRLVGYADLQEVPKNGD